MVVADDRMPIWHRRICNKNGDAGRSTDITCVTTKNVGYTRGRLNVNMLYQYTRIPIL